MCFDRGREREQEREIDIERNIKRSRSAVRPQLEWRPTPVGARGPLSLSRRLSVSLFLSSWTCRSLSTLHSASTSQIQASSAQPCVAISGNSFGMLPVHCIHSSLALSLHPHNPPSTCLPLYYLSHKPSLFSHKHAETTHFSPISFYTF